MPIKLMGPNKSVKRLLIWQSWLVIVALQQLLPPPKQSLPRLNRWFDAEPTITGARRRLRSAISTAVKRDPIVDEVTNDVHRYNTHSSPVLAAHRAVRTALCVISLAPNIAGPAAQVALFASVVLSGGSESSKVMKELYMDKRLESRVETLAEETHLILENHKIGVLTNNASLARCSEELLVRLVGQDRATSCCMIRMRWKRLP